MAAFNWKDNRLDTIGVELEANQWMVDELHDIAKFNAYAVKHIDDCREFAKKLYIQIPEELDDTDARMPKLMDWFSQILFYHVNTGDGKVLAKLVYLIAEK